MKIPMMMVALAIVLTGCGTTSGGLRYAPQATATQAVASQTSVVVGSFIDQRGEPAKWLGAIRGGFGNPLKNLESNEPVADLVRAAFADGLRARGFPVDAPASTRQLTGVVRKLDTNQYVRREANVEIEVTVTDVASNQQRFTRTYTATNVEGSMLSLKTGVFASVEELRAITEKTLSEVIDKALEDTALRNALRP